MSVIFALVVHPQSISTITLICPMLLVDHDTFLKGLTDLFESKKENGSVWITTKRLRHDGEDTTMKHEEGTSDTREYPCLLRVTDGKSSKFSTKVEPEELTGFFAQYGLLLKSSMSTLRKRDKKREKTRAEEVAKRRHKMTEPITLDGSKRGKGRKLRQRKIKALLKQQASQKKFQEREEVKKQPSL